MKRLAIYAHWSSTPKVAAHVLFCLQHLAEMGFEICFVSNSEISSGSEIAVKKFAGRVIVRENTGLDFCMWQRGLVEYELGQYEELLLTNSSIIGPLQPLAPVWASPHLAGCDFWGLTDSDELKPHLSSYFFVFRRPVLHSERFREFWRSVLPYQNKWQVIFSYELGLTAWLEEGGFQWGAAFPHAQIMETVRANRGLWKKYQDQFRALDYIRLNRQLPPRNVTLLYPDLLLKRGMPFLKLSLLHQESMRITPAKAFAFLEKSALPGEVVEELRQLYPVA